MDTLLLRKHTSVEFALFTDFAEFLCRIKYRRAKYSKAEFYGYLAELLGETIEISSVQGYFSKTDKVASIPAARFWNFCERFIDIFRNLDTALKQEYSEIDNAFWLWRKALYEREGWEDKYQSKIAVDPIFKESQIVDKDLMEAKNVLINHFIGIQNRDIDRYWNSLSTLIKATQFRVEKEKFEPVWKYQFRKVFPINFERISDSIIHSSVFVEVNVHDHITYSVYLQDLNASGKEDELKNHKLGLINYFYFLRKNWQGSEEEFAQYYLEYNGLKCVSVRTIFELGYLNDNPRIAEVLPLVKYAYIKTDFTCIFSYEHGGWKISNIYSRLQVTDFPYTYPQFFIPLRSNST